MNHTEMFRKKVTKETGKMLTGLHRAFLSLSLVLIRAFSTFIQFSGFSERSEQGFLYFANSVCRYLLLQQQQQHGKLTFCIHRFLMMMMG
jgi:hypothetical protein